MEKSKDLGKRKKSVVPLEKKLEAIKRLDQGETLKKVCIFVQSIKRLQAHEKILFKVAADYGVGVSTVGDWKQNKQKIEQYCSVLASPAPQRKTMKKAEHQKIDEALYLWFTQQRNKGVPLSGPILQQKALSLSEELPLAEAPDTFTDSEGWLARWKNRHGIRQLKICGEKLSADESLVESFKKNFRKIMEEENYTPDQLYNCDETGLNFKILPSKTLASKNESAAPGHKKK